MRRRLRVPFLFVFVSAAWASSEAASPGAASPDADVGPALNEVVITGTYRPSAEIDVPASVSVLDATTLREAGQAHLEDVLALIPNLNWAGDTSRPRYFQIRGIGELEQYQGAPKPLKSMSSMSSPTDGLGAP